MIMNDDVVGNKEILEPGIQKVSIKNIENKPTKNGNGNMWVVTLCSGNAETTAYLLYDFKANVRIEKMNQSKICDLLFACNMFVAGNSMDMNNVAALMNRDILVDIEQVVEEYNGNEFLKAEILNFYNLKGEIRSSPTLKKQRKTATEIQAELEKTPRIPRNKVKKVPQTANNSSPLSYDDDVPF